MRPFSVPGFGKASAPGSPPPSSTQWRLNFTAQQDATKPVATYEVEMRATSGGADQCNGGTASASSSFGGAASAAFDNDFSTTSWIASSNSMPQWLQYTFPSAVSVAELSITGQVLSNGSAPIAFDLQYWDGAAWQTARSFTSPATWTNRETRLFS